MKVNNPNLSRNEKLRIKYNMIYDMYQDSELARKGSQWGWDRINDVLNISKPPLKKLEKFKDNTRDKIQKQYSKKAITQKKVVANKVKYILDAGFDPQAIKRFKRKSYQVINNNLEDFEFDGKVYKIYSPPTREERFKVWKYWSDRKHKYMPKPVYNLSVLINRMANEKESNKQKRSFKKEDLPKYIGEEKFVTDTSKFGFSVNYFKYLEKMELDNAFKVVEPNTQDPYGYVYSQMVW